METSTTIPSVIMVDDNSLASAALCRRFAGSTDVKWLGSTTDSDAAVPMVLEQRPTVVLLDVEMPGVDTFALLRRMVSECSGTAVVMCSGHDQPSLIERALNDGANGYIHKDEPTAVITDLLLRAARGECVLSPLASRAYMRTNHD
jgi:DNA-binding NarL/FixJ family response regulator